jgi:hypothetical protein
VLFRILYDQISNLKFVIINISTSAQGLDIEKGFNGEMSKIEILKRVLFDLLSAVISTCTILLYSTISFASINIPLDSPFYANIDMLVVHGLIKSDLSSTKPFTRAEAGRLLAEALYYAEMEEIPASTSDLLDRMAQDYEEEISQAKIHQIPRRTYFKPVDEFFITYNYLDGPFSMFNNEGIEYFDGKNAMAQFQSQASLWGVFSFYIQPLLLYNQNFQGIDRNDETEVRVHKGYVKFSLGNFEIELGRDSLWWGPVYHGALLLSNNARPFDMIKISNPLASVLPWIFRYLGPFKYQLFLAELDKEAASEHPPNSKLIGLRFDFKPHPLFEFGTSYLIQFAGERPGIGSLDFSDYLKIVFSNECRDLDKLDSNKEFAVDVAITVPDVSRILPLAESIKLYAEWGGEDSGYPPIKRAYILGVAFNDAFTVHGLKLRSEYADISPHRSPRHWYTHSVWAMKHYGRVFGHHAGTDSEDLFIELSYRIKDKFLYRVGFDKERSGIGQANTQEKYQYFIEAGYRFKKWFNLTVRYEHEEINNVDNVKDSAQENQFIGTEMRFRF